MKRRVIETYHFERDDGRDNFCHRTIDDTIGILGGVESIAGPDPRVASALNSLQQGFTIEQYLVATISIMAAFEARELRHGSEQNDFSRAVVDQTRTARRFFMVAMKQMMESIGEAQVERRDGFEKFRVAQVS